MNQRGQTTTPTEPPRPGAPRDLSAAAVALLEKLHTILDDDGLRIRER